MDNIQDTGVDPKGQSAPVEQVPAVQSEATTPTVPPVESPTETPKPFDETSFEAIASKKGFKSPDDLAKAYANLERQTTRVSQKAADYEKVFFSQPQEQKQEVYAMPNLTDETKALDELDKFVNERTQKAISQAELKFRTELAKIELNQVIEKTPDFGDYVTEVKELKTKYPEMSFRDAYTFAKALKGDLISEAKAEGLREGTKLAYKQATAQVAPTKAVAEEKTITPTELLQNASKRWTVRPGMKQEDIQRIRAEQDFVARQLQERSESERDFLAFNR